MTTGTDAFLAQADPGATSLFAPLLEARAVGLEPAWAAAQSAFLAALDRYVDEELAHPADWHINTHEAGGQCRIWFPHYQVRGGRRMLDHMHAIFEARADWIARNQYHGYVDCSEVHHDPETFLYFQVPLMHLTGEAKIVAAVEDFAHHVGNWAEGVPDWYDWSRREFRSTWLGTRAVRDYPPYDYQEANHFRFIAPALAVYVTKGDGRYLAVAEDYANRWCDHIEQRAQADAPIACSILPEHVQRSEMGHSGEIPDDARQGEYPVFYATVAQNTTYDVVTVMLDLFRLTGNVRYAAAARAMIAQFFDHADEHARPAHAFAGGSWRHVDENSDRDALLLATSGANDLLVRMAEKYRTVTCETTFDGALLRWAAAVDESRYAMDQLPISLLVAAHRLTGDASYLDRACRMAIRGMTLTESNTKWHQCSATGRYGFKYQIDVLYHPMLAGVDYATRGGLPLAGLSHRTEDRPGLPAGVRLRSWEPTPLSFELEAVNIASQPATWCIDKSAARRRVRSLAATAGAELSETEQGWTLRVPPNGVTRYCGTWEP